MRVLQVPGAQMIQRPAAPGQLVQRHALPVRKPVPGLRPGVSAAADAKGAAPSREKRKFESLK